MTRPLSEPTRLRLPRFDDPVQRLAYSLRTAGMGQKRILRTLERAFPSLDHLVLEGRAREAAAQTPEHAHVRHTHDFLTDEEWASWDGTEEHLRKFCVDRLPTLHERGPFLLPTPKPLPGATVHLAISADRVACGVRHAVEVPATTTDRTQVDCRLCQRTHAFRGSLR